MTDSKTTIKSSLNPSKSGQQVAFKVTVMAVQPGEGVVEPSKSVEIDFPHYQSFVVTINRHDKIGWVFARENDDSLGAASLSGTSSAQLDDSISETILNVPGLGKVRDTGEPSKVNKLAIDSYGDTVEWSIWYGPNNYSQGDVEP